MFQATTDPTDPQTTALVVSTGHVSSESPAPAAAAKGRSSSWHPPLPQQTVQKLVGKSYDIAMYYIYIS